MALGLTLGVTLGASATPGTSPASTSAASGTSVTAVTPAGPVASNLGKLLWKIQSGETIYVNARASLGGNAWVAYTVVSVFGDGNAVLTREPDCVVYTGALAVGINLRRVGEIYADSYPGPP